MPLFLRSPGGGDKRADDLLAIGRSGRVYARVGVTGSGLRVHDGLVTHRREYQDIPTITGALTRQREAWVLG